MLTGRNRACGESIDVIMGTVVAAASQVYPKSSNQVFVLDDGQSDDLRKMIEHLNQRASIVKPGRLPVVYLARDKATNASHYKFGNIRFGLRGIFNLYGGSQYVAALDADMISEETWLARTVRYLENNQQIAMAGPPQNFHNVRADDILGQDSGVFAQILEPLRDRFGFSQCCGSGYVMRRDALDSIVGWPLCNVG